MAKKRTDVEQVQQYMDALQHPMKAEIETLGSIIQGSDPRISVRIKWNAPSYYYHEDMVTFGPPARKNEEILLVFHHPSVVEIPSPILTGDFKDRRLATFKSMAEVEASRGELERIMHETVTAIEAKMDH